MSRYKYNRINTSAVFERPTKPLTGCRNIGWPLAARNSNYYSTSIADRTESLHTEWRRTYPDGSCNFDLNGRRAVRRSKCRRALGRLGSAGRPRQARRDPPEAEPSRPLLSCQGAWYTHISRIGAHRVKMDCALSLRSRSLVDQSQKSESAGSNTRP